MLRGCKIRIYPTKEQEKLMWTQINCSRAVWNIILRVQQDRFKTGLRRLSLNGTLKVLTKLKQTPEYAWLKEADAAYMQVVCEDVNQAYVRAFTIHNGLPHFKSKKRAKTAFPLRIDKVYVKDKRFIHAEKIGDLRFKTDYILPIGKNTLRNPRISYDRKKWYISFVIERENQAQELTDKSMGIDLGIKELAVIEYDGQKIVFPNINNTKKMKDLEKRLKYHQRSIARKYQASKKRNDGEWVKTINIVKEQEKISRLFRRMSDIRRNYLHQTTHSLVSMLPFAVVMQDLNIMGMLKNHKLAKAVKEQAFRTFLCMMQYKCQEYGIQFVQVGRFYPSSKTCSNCGSVKDDLKLSERIFRCPDCGFEIDRDYNAAINLSRYVISVDELQS